MSDSQDKPEWLLIAEQILTGERDSEEVLERYAGPRPSRETVIVPPPDRTRETRLLPPPCVQGSWVRRSHLDEDMYGYDRRKEVA